MSTMNRFKTFRARNAERAAHRAMMKHEYNSAKDFAQRDVLLYTSRLM